MKYMTKIAKQKVVPLFQGQSRRHDNSPVVPAFAHPKVGHLSSARCVCGGGGNGVNAAER